MEYSIQKNNPNYQLWKRKRFAEPFETICFQLHEIKKIMIIRKNLFNFTEQY